MEELSWLGVLRHGQSTGNVLRERAEDSGAETIDVPDRDADVPLTPLGEQQAGAVGAWLRELPADQRPDVVITSPYRRAAATAAIAVDGSGAAVPVRTDERLRDRELGILDMLTGCGVARRYPEEAARRRWLGKFYYRPPGGESWADVALRLRGVLGDLRQRYGDRRVLLVGHEAVILLLRYLVEDLGEAELLDIGRSVVLANGGLTSWERVDGSLRLTGFNRTDHLRAHGGTPTRESDVQTEPV